MIPYALLKDFASFFKSIWYSIWLSNPYSLEFLEKNLCFGTIVSLCQVTNPLRSYHLCYHAFVNPNLRQLQFRLVVSGSALTRRVYWVRHRYSRVLIGHCVTVEYVNRLIFLLHIPKFFPSSLVWLSCLKIQTISRFQGIFCMKIQRSVYFSTKHFLLFDIQDTGINRKKFKFEQILETVHWRNQEDHRKFGSEFCQLGQKIPHADRMSRVLAEE